MRAVQRRAIRIHVVLPVVAGAAIYVAWRSPSLNLFRWLELIGLSSAALELRAILGGVREFLPRILLFSGPDALWVYALTSAMLLIWRGPTRSIRAWLWISAGFTISFVTELGQALDRFPGTFDAADLICTFGAALLAIWNLRRKDIDIQCVVTSSA
jgi:hypothetical protein